MHAFRGKNGKILAPCVHFRVRSGGFGCMARKSCRQGRLFASRGPRSCMARRTCQRCSTSSWQRPVVCSNGLCALSPIPGLLDAWVHPCNPGRAHRYRYHALPLACDRRTACALPTPHPHPRSACRSRYRVPSGSRPGDVAPWRYRPQPAIASRCTACVPPACDRRRSCYLTPRCHPRRHLRRTRFAPPPVTSPIAVGGGLPIGRFPRTPAPHRPTARAPGTVPVIPAKWCGDTIAHTRKLRF